MNNKLLFAVVLGLVTAGCASGGLLSVRDCETHSPVAHCQGNPDVPVVTLNTNTMKANPPNVCAKRGKTIVYNIVPRPANVGTVTVVPKIAADTWLTGTNSPDKAKLSITIPNWVVLDTDHDYSVVTNSGKCLDPRVRIK